MPRTAADQVGVRAVKRAAITLVTAALAVLLGCAAGSYAREALRPSPSGPVPLPARHAAAAPAPAEAPAPSAAPAPAPVDRCAGNGYAQLVIVDLSAQHAWMCERGRTVHDTPITSGMQGAATATPTGRFAVDGKTRDTTLYPSAGGAYPVRYWITWDAPLYGFHDSAWQTIPYGSAQYRTGGSHGCVHMPLPAMRFLYGWVQIGTPVHIRA